MTTESDATCAPDTAGHPPRASEEGRYPHYVLSILILVYVLNFVDRQILAVLAEDIKADLGISDADLGFLFGAAFAVFYAVLGLPLARLADIWNRKRLIAIGLSFWSLMTALSGLARSFLPLAACRFGVGVGEASASPAAYSLLYDYFPPRVRTTVLSLYSGGVFIGQGIGLFLGGTLLHLWAAAFPDPAMAPFGLRGWQAAFFAVGLPGLLVAVWVATLREPLRGGMDGLVSPPHPHPFREATGLLAAMLPPTSFILLTRRGGGRMTAMNASAAAVIGAASWALVRSTGDTEQWVALGVGAYAVVCWIQMLNVRDRVCSRLIFGNRTLMYTIVGIGAANFMLNSFAYWSVPYYQRRFHLDPAEVGLMIGSATALMGLLGVAIGGVLSDRLRRRHRAGKLWVVLFSLCGSLVFAALLLAAPDVRTAYCGSIMLMLLSSASLGPCVSTINDLVLPRMRATASAFGFMITYMIAGALGPYFIGKLSDLFTASTGDSGQALRLAMACSLVIPFAGIAFSMLAVRTIHQDEPQLLQRARELGEPA